LRGLVFKSGLGWLVLCSGLALLSWSEPFARDSVSGHDGAFLSPEVGARLSEVIRSPEVSGALPVGWKILAVDIGAGGIEVRVGDQDASEHIVRLDPPRPGSTRGGRWFSFEIGQKGVGTKAEMNSEVKTDPETSKVLYRLAAVIDGVFEQSPWTRSAGREPSRRVPRPSNRNRLFMQWFALILVAAQFLAICVFTMAGFRYLRRDS